MENTPFDDLYNLPKKYVFPRFSRYFTLSMGILIIFYVIYLIFFRLTADSSAFAKIVPFIIAYLALDSVSRNLFNLNKVLITDQGICFKFIAKKTVFIPWLRMTKMDMYKGKAKAFVITYTANSEEKKFQLTMQFPNMIEIVNLIAYQAPHIEFDQFTKSIIVAAPKQEN